MRLKADGSLDLDWREPAPAKTPEQLDEEMGERILDNVLSNNPLLTREEAQAMLAHFL
jgi:hypothetical protein